MKNITIFGSGYVGLVTGACFADMGHHVLCVDCDEVKINQLKQGIVPIHEPGLDALLEQHLATGKLEFTTDSAHAIEHGHFLFIAVGTPALPSGGADLAAVEQVARQIGRSLQSQKIIVNKSTVPVHTAERVKQWIGEELALRQQQIPYSVVSNPEFLKEGAAIDDFIKPDRVIIGADDAYSIAAMRELYAPFNRNHDRVIVMDTRSAELTKYAANAMLATKISFINELSNIAEQVGADIEQVRVGIGSDHRIGYDFIYPGCGYGGSCFPKDVRALAATAQQAAVSTPLLVAVDDVNRQQKQVLFRKVQHYFQQQLTDKVIAVWGLSFKPNTDDIREAPSRQLIEALWQAGARVQAFDPCAADNFAKKYGTRDDLWLASDEYQALEGADALVIATEWRLFRSPDFNKMQQMLRQPVIFDGRNLYDPELMRAQGFQYFAIGRGDNVWQ